MKDACRLPSGTVAEQTSNRETEFTGFLFPARSNICGLRRGERGRENIIRRTMYTKRTSPRSLRNRWLAPRRSKKGIAATDLFHPAGTLKRFFLFVSAISKCWGVGESSLVLYVTVKSGAPNIGQFFSRNYTRDENTSHFALQATRGEDRLAFCTVNSRAFFVEKEKGSKLTQGTRD